jgi:hypothetical protein
MIVLVKEQRSERILSKRIGIFTAVIASPFWEAAPAQFGHDLNVQRQTLCGGPR